MKIAEKTNNLNIEFKPDRIKMIAGLGNPGAAYRHTYHNIGYLAIDFLSDQEPESGWRRGNKFTYLRTGGWVFVKPAMFMNESGEALKQAAKYFKVRPENLLVINDDSDLEIGKYKIGFGRGAAGHRGAASVISSFKTNDFWRARIGARSQPGKAGGFVLKKINPGDRKKITAVFGDLKRLLTNPKNSD